MLSKGVLDECSFPGGDSGAQAPSVLGFCWCQHMTHKVTQGVSSFQATERGKQNRESCADFCEEVFNGKCLNSIVQNLSTWLDPTTKECGNCGLICALEEKEMSSGEHMVIAAYEAET